jgi:hypothetical protein
MSIKILFAPLNFGNIIQDGVVDAFQECGCTVQVFDYMDKYLHCKNHKTVREALINSSKEFKPDIIHLQIQHTPIIDADTILKIKEILPKVIITNWTGDVRNYVPITYKKIAEVVDYNFISSTGQLSMFKSEINKDIKYWQIGYNPKLYTPNTEIKNPKYDAVFVGHYNGKEKYPGTIEREQTCQLLRNKFGGRFLLTGCNWPKKFGAIGSVDQRIVTNTYQNSVCCISVSHYNNLDHYFSDRLLMCMASGRPTISLKFPKWESYFTNMCDLIIADSVNDIPDIVSMLKNNPDLASYIGQSGASKVLAEHTYYCRVKEFLKKV